MRRMSVMSGRLTYRQQLMALLYFDGEGVLAQPYYHYVRVAVRAWPVGVFKQMGANRAASDAGR